MATSRPFVRTDAAEFERAWALLSDAAARAAVVVIEGEPGIGKTTLWSALIEAARTAGMRVMAVRPTAAEAGVPFAGLNDIVRGSEEVLERLAPPRRRILGAALGTEPIDEPVDAGAVPIAFQAFVDECCQSGPTVLGVDDWQWLDPPSEAALRFALRRLAPGGRALAAVRTGDEWADLAPDLDATGTLDVLRLALGPLGPRNLHRVVHAHTGRWLSAPDLDRIHAASRGNPLAAIELAREPDAGDVLPDVRRLIALRLGRLPPRARAALRVASALARPDERTIEAAFERSAEAHASLEAALGAGVLVRDGTELRLWHPLVAAVIRDQTPAGQWRALHRRLASVVNDPELRARHLGLAADTPDEAAAGVIEAAAERAFVRGAPASAGELAQRSADLTPEPEIDAWARRMLLAAEGWEAAGDGARAIRIALTMTERLPAGPLRCDALCRLADLDAEQSLRWAEQACDEAGADPRRLARIELIRSRHYLVCGPLDAAIEHARLAAEHAGRSGDTTLRRMALTELAIDRFAAGEGAQEAALLEAHDLDRPHAARGVEDESPMAQLGMQRFMTGDFEAGRAALQRALEDGIERGSFGRHSFALLQLADLELRAGRIADAEGYAEQALRHAIGSEISNFETAGRWIFASVQAQLGHVAVAQEHALAAIRLADAQGDLIFGAQSRRLLGLISLCLEDKAGAVGWLQAAFDAAVTAFPGEPGVFAVEPDLVEALVHARDLDAAQAVTARLEDLAVRLDRPWAHGMARRCRGLMASAQGDAERAVSEHAAALEVITEIGQPFEVGRTLLMLGAAERRIKRTGAARASLARAEALFDELRAPLWAQRARSEQARVGGRARDTGGGLTATEQRIADLAAGGATNREIAEALFVAERTVEANLTRVYRKLGVRSRTQLARLRPGSAA